MFVFCEFVNCLIFQERQNWDFLQEKCFAKHRNFFFKTSRREKQRKKTFLNEIRFFEKKEKISNFVSTFEKLVFSLSVDFFRESGQFANRNRNRNRTGPVNCRLAVCLSFKIFFLAEGRNEPRSVHFGDLSSTPALQKKILRLEDKTCRVCFSFNPLLFPGTGGKGERVGENGKRDERGKISIISFLHSTEKKLFLAATTKGFSCNERRRGK